MKSQDKVAVVASDILTSNVGGRKGTAEREKANPRQATAYYWQTVLKQPEANVHAYL
jgi:hypothetical protein